MSKQDKNSHWRRSCRLEGISSWNKPNSLSKHKWTSDINLPAGWKLKYTSKNKEKDNWKIPKINSFQPGGNLNQTTNPWSNQLAEEHKDPTHWRLDRQSTTVIPEGQKFLEEVNMIRGKGACKYYISRFSLILDPPTPLNKQHKHGLRPPTPPLKCLYNT